MRGFDRSVPEIVLGGVAVAVVLGVIVGASTSGAAFGAYNAAWDGASDLRAVSESAGTESILVRNVDRYGTVPANGSVAVVLSPDRPYGDDEAARLRAFVRRGGTLVVAEDVGPYGNLLLADVGARARVDGALLRDERRFHRAPALPIATNVTSDSVDIEQLTLNYGTVVRPHGATVLVRSSEFGYLDRNRNGRLDDQERLASLPVVTSERVDAGRIVVVSDPSALINAMIERPGNRRLVRELFADHERVLLDYSHAERLPPLAVAVLVVRESPLLTGVVGLAFVGLVGAWSRWPTLRERRPGGPSGPLRSPAGPDSPERAALPGLSEDELRAYVRRRHPEWDDERVGRVVKAIRRRSQKE